MAIESSFPEGTVVPGASSATQYSFDNPRRDYTATETVQMMPASIAAAIVQTPAESLGLLEKGQMEKYMSQLSPDLGNYYAQSGDAYRTVADLATMWIPGLVAMNAIKSTGTAMRVLGSAGRYGEMLKNFISVPPGTSSAMRGFYREAISMGKSGQLGELGHNSLTLTTMRNRALLDATLNGMKKNIAFELGVATTHNASETLYPSEWSIGDHLAMASLGVGLGAGVDYAIARAATKKAIGRMGQYADQALNANNLPLSEVISRPGERSAMLVTYGVWNSQLKQLTDTAQELGQSTVIKPEVLKQNANSARNIAEQTLKTQFEGVAQDGIVGVIPGHQLAGDQLATLMHTVNKVDPIYGAGLRALTDVPHTNSKLVDLFQKRTDALVTKQGKLNELLTVLDDDTIEEAAKSSMRTEYAKLESEINLLRDGRFEILRPNGNVSLLDATYKARLHDLPNAPKIVTVPKSASELKKFQITVPQSMDVGAKDLTIKVTETGSLLFPAIDQMNLATANTKRVVTNWAAEKPTLILRDMGQDWHFEQNRGKQIFDNLSSEIQTEIRNWTKASSRSQIRDWIAKDTPQGRELVEAYAPFRARLSELADAQDGAITLYRGQKKAETLSPTNDVVSMTSDWGTAKQFAGIDGEVIAARVPIDDIVMPIGGLGDEFEFIVRGHRTRGQQNMVEMQTWDSLGVLPRSAAFELLGKSADEFVAAYRAGKPVTAHLNMQDHWTRFDWALRVRELDPNAAQFIHLPKGLDGDWARLQMEVLDQKAQAFARMHDAANVGTSLPALANKALSRDDILFSLNLPVGLYGDAHPVEQMLLALRAQGDTSVKEAFKNLDDFVGVAKGQALLPDGATIKSTLQPDLLNFLERPMALQGDNLHYQPGARSVLAFKENIPQSDLNRLGLIEQPMMRQMQRMATFGQRAAANGADFVNAIHDAITGNSYYQASLNVHELAEGSQFGKGTVGQAGWMNRQIATLTALDTNMAARDKVIHKQIEKWFSAEYGNQFAKEVQNTRSIESVLSHFRSHSPEAREAQTTFAIFRNSRAYAWELSPAPVVRDNGTYQFKLRNTEKNRQIWRREFGEDMPENSLMPAMVGSGRGQPVTVTERAFEVIDILSNHIGAKIYANNSYLRRAMGMPGLNKVDWWIPPKNFDGQYVGYIVQEAEFGGNPIKYMISARSPGELSRLKEMPAVKKMLETPGTVWYDQADMGKRLELTDNAFFDLIDMGDSLLQNAGAKGSSASKVLETGVEVLNDIVRSVTKQANSIGRRTTALVYEPQIRRVKELHSQANYFGTDPSVWQNYVDKIVGRNSIRKDGLVGAVYNSIESGYDNLLAKVSDNAASFLRTVGAEKLARPMSETEFNQMKGKLGGQLPFSNAVEFFETAAKVSTPQSMREHMAAFNWAVTTITLRLFDAAHALLNMGGTAANLPAVLRAMQKVPGESEAAWKTRVGAFASPVGSKGLAAFNPMRAFANSIHDGFTDAGKQVWAEAKRLGYLDQEAAEIARTLSSPQESFARSKLTKTINLLSRMSDKSEEVARGWAHLAGYRLAEQHLGITNPKDLHMFAHRFANTIIGDYRSINRPQVFQGAVGMPLGLFQTYMWNFYHRMFSYVENRNFRAIGYQYFMQGALFGAQTVPGWSQLMAMYDGAADGAANPVDGLRNKFGDEVADVVLYGALSNLPKVFGAPDGITLYSRADANIGTRAPAFINPANAPIVGLATSIGNILGSTADMMKDGGQFNRQQMLETLGTYLTNRPLRGLMEIAAGVSVDTRGQVIADETQSGMAIAARMIGLRPLMEGKLNDAYFRNRNFELSQQEHRQRLRSSILPMIRSGNITGEDMADALRNYLDSGGKPENFAMFLRDAATTALMMRTDRQFKEALGSDDMASVMRLMHVMSPLQDNELGD